MNIDTYLDRIGAVIDPNMAALKIVSVLQRCHILSIPFDNSFIVDGRSLDVADHWTLESIYKRIVMNGEGDICVGHAILFSWALTMLGIPSTLRAARVLVERDWNEAIATHLLVIATIDDEKYICDVGFGGKYRRLHLEPIRLRIDTSHTYTLSISRDEYLLTTSDQRPLYSMKMYDIHPTDLTLITWYICTHPDSRLMKSIIVSL